MAAKRTITIEPIAMPQLGEADREILEKSVDDGVYDLAMAKEIRLDRIRPDPTQPRREMDPEGLEELANSIKEQGVLNPISVEYVREEDYFLIVHGERRWRAAQMAGLKNIPALIRRMDGGDRLIQQLIENIQREDLNPVDRGQALKRLREELQLSSWQAVGERIGVGRRRVHQLLATTELAPVVQEDLRAGVISEKDTRIYRGLSTEHQVALHKARRGRQLTTEDTAQAARLLKDDPDLEVSQVILRTKEDSRSPVKGSTRERGGRTANTIRSVIGLNRRLQRALPSLEVDDLSPGDRGELKQALESLQGLIEQLLGQLED